jgi:TonB family protein
MKKTLACMLVAIVAAAASPVWGGPAENLATVRALYSSADYENALTLLDQAGPAEGASVVDVEQYRALCYVALGDTQRARRAIEHLVFSKPDYRLTGADVSPRVEALFTEVRRQVLPDVVRQAFAIAKDSFTQGDTVRAAGQFHDLQQLLDDPELAGMADLRTIVSGYLDLTGERLRASAPAATAPAVTVARQPDKPATYTADTHGITPPTTISQTLPPFILPLREPLHAVMEVVIGEDGRVLEAQMRAPTNTPFDYAAVAAARKWQYRPAVLNGKPVRFQKLVNVTVTPPPAR